MRRIIHLVDGGQDFSSWTVDETGLVVDCQPFQGWIWIGAQVLDVKGLEPGSTIRLRMPGRESVSTLAYAVERIEVLTEGAAA